MGKKNKRILKVYWSKKENDFMIQYPRRCDGALIQSKLFTQNMIFDLIKYHTERSRDRHILPYVMEMDLIKEFVHRGYDKTTMKFEIRLSDDTELE